jgi:hypothetical protein
VIRLPTSTALGFAAIACVSLLVGCQQERKVVKWNPMLGNVAGAQSGMPVVRDYGEYSDPTKVPDNKIRVEDEQGKPLLLAKSGRHLMSHIYITLRDDEKELFTQQVLSERTRDEFRANGLDEGEAFDRLKARFEDIRMLFDLMPYAEYTPGVRSTRIDTRVQRVEIKGIAAQGLYWGGFDMVLEKGNWKLRWFVPGSN